MNDLKPVSDLLLILLVTLFCQPTASADHRIDHLTAHQSFESELANVRALPFGFSAVCVDLILRINSKNSATFIIRDSELCKFRSLSISKAKRKMFTLCSNDPAHHSKKSKSSIAKCADLDFELREL